MAQPLRLKSDAISHKKGTHQDEDISRPNSMCAYVYMHVYAHLFVRATICRKSLLFQINRANKFYVRSFIFIEWASKETLSNARHTQCGDGNRNWSKTVRFGMELNWIWICACVCVCVLDVFRLISVSQFDIVRMHAKTIDGNVKANYSRIFLFVCSIGDWVGFLSVCIRTCCRKWKPSSAPSTRWKSVHYLNFGGNARRTKKIAQRPNKWKVRRKKNNWNYFNLFYVPSLYCDVDVVFVFSG